MPRGVSDVPGTDKDLDRAIGDRYSRAAQSREGALCCPVDYDPRTST